MGGTKMSKKSIRFFNDREVRAVWDDAHAKWWFSATDIVRAINDEDDYVKAGNYWRWLKKKINTEGIQLVSVTHDFKFQAPDGKQRLADALDAECVQTVANNYPNNRALLHGAMTDKINDREIFMKGIDYSYNYEQSDLVSEEPNSLGSGVL